MQWSCSIHVPHAASKPDQTNAYGMAQLERPLFHVNDCVNESFVNHSRLHECMFVLHNQ